MDPRMDDVEQAVDELRREVTELRAELEGLRAVFVVQVHAGDRTAPMTAGWGGGCEPSGEPAPDPMEGEPSHDPPGGWPEPAGEPMDPETEDPFARPAGEQPAPKAKRAARKPYDPGHLGDWREDGPGSGVFLLASFRHPERESYRVVLAGGGSCTCAQRARAATCKHIQTMAVVDRTARECSLSRLHDELLPRYEGEPNRRAVVMAALRLRAERLAARNGTDVRAELARWLPDEGQAAASLAGGAA